MQSWGTQREVEKVKPLRANKAIVVETPNCRFTIRLAFDDVGGASVWLGMDYDSLPEFIIGIGASADTALSDAVANIEAIETALQSKPFPAQWSDDDRE